MVHGQDLTWYMVMYMVVNMGHEHGASHEWAVHLKRERIAVLHFCGGQILGSVKIEDPNNALGLKTLRT